MLHIDQPSLTYRHLLVLTSSGLTCLCPRQRGKDYREGGTLTQRLEIVRARVHVAVGGFKAFGEV